jgi:hypothetical protein
MAASATGMTTTADGMKTSEALRGTGGRTTRSASRNTRRAKGGNSKSSFDELEENATMTLTGNDAKVGEIVEFELKFETGNQCTCYDMLVEFDSRFEFVGVEGAKAFSNFEEGGRKFVSLVGYEVSPYQDGQTVAKIKLRVPEGAENDDYEVRVSQVTSFSTDYADFENYKINNAVIKVTGGVDKKQTDGIRLVSTTGVAGDSAVVQLVPHSGNKCVAYDLLVEYDSRLLLEDKDVANANSFCIFEADGKCYVSLVGYTSGVFADGDVAAALNFHIPADATPDDTFEVKIATVTDFSSSYASFENFETEDAVISIFQSSRPNDKFQEHKVFKKFAANGALIGSAVGMRGDSNGDGKADVRDAAATASYCASKKGVDEMGQFFADVDDSGKMDVRDAAKIARYVASGKTSWDKINGGK